MGLETSRKYRVIWNHPAIIHYHSVEIEGESTVIRGPPSVLRITIVTCLSLPNKRFGIPLAAGSIGHAGCVPVQTATRSMDHAGLYDLIEVGVTIWVRDLYSNDVVNLLCHNLGLQPQENVNVRETSLLPLHGVHEAPQISKDASLGQKRHHLFDHELEDSPYNVVTVMGFLAR